MHNEMPVSGAGMAVSTIRNSGFYYTGIGGFHDRTGGGNAKSKILLSMYQLGEYISAHTHCFTIRFP